MFKLLLILGIMLVSYFFTTCNPRHPRETSQEKENGGDETPPFIYKTHTYIHTMPKTHTIPHPRDKPQRLSTMTYKEWCILNEEYNRIRSRLIHI